MIKVTAEKIDEQFNANHFADRIYSTIFTAIYLFSFMYIYETYITIEWGYTGFFYSSLSFFDYFFIYFSVLVSSYFFPTRISTPSSAIIWLLALMVYVPTLPVTLMIGQKETLNYYLPLSALTLVIITASVISSRNVDSVARDFDPDKKSIFFFSIAFLFFVVIQFFVYQDVLAFASIDETYDQRALSSDFGGGAIDYVRTYFPYVFCSYIFALGLRYKSYYYYIFFGFFGFLFSYLIDASKVSFIIPLVIIGFFVVIRWFSGKTYLLTAGLAGLTLISGQLVTYSYAVKIAADLVVLRSIAIPAQMFALYGDLFDKSGYTFWSNARFINLYIPPPDSFAADPNWPELGRIVGTEYYGAGSQLNANANLFAGEGVAAAGAFGVMIIGALMISWLTILDRLSQRWDRTLSILLCVPLGMALTNAHLTTLLLSYGGAFWLVVFFFYRPQLKSGSA